MDKTTLSLLTEQQASVYMAVSVAALRKWRVKDRGPTFFKLNRLVRYRPEDLDQWIATRPQGGERSISGPAQTGRIH
jgi:hypothetical protein